MNYRVVIDAHAGRQMRKLPTDILSRILKALAALRENPRPHGVEKLAGPSDRYRIRVGDYRVVYEIDDPSALATVVQVGHRSDVYR